jgi:predicted RNase H-like nuclease (RuvC/YqgF family)
MYSELLHYVKLLEKIKKQGSVTPEIRKQILKSQSKIIKIKNRVDSFSKDYDNDSEIRKKLRKTLIKITIANYYIKRMQEKIKDLPGVNDLFIELQNKGMRK